MYICIYMLPKQKRSMMTIIISQFLKYKSIKKKKTKKREKKKKKKKKKKNNNNIEEDNSTKEYISFSLIVENLGEYLLIEFYHQLAVSR